MREREREREICIKIYRDYVGNHTAFLCEELIIRGTDLVVPCFGGCWYSCFNGERMSWSQV